jgi:hypothetical protein
MAGGALEIMVEIPGRRIQGGRARVLGGKGLSEFMAITISRSGFGERHFGSTAAEAEARVIAEL